jgi:uncharacterized protein involved in exopolysaccharide biosynthesis
MTAAGSTGYVAISRRALDLEDYIDIARRHAGWIVGPTFAGIVIATVVAFLMENTYVSTAQMQITPQQISASIVPTTINQLLAERIMSMENEILSRTSLSAIIQDPRLDLYKADRDNKPLEDVIETMRSRDIKISIQSLPSGNGTRASAFSISFSYPDRLKAQQTVQALITKFTDANQNAQRVTQDVVKSYVHDELSQAKAQLDQLDDELTKFRVENSGKLPEQTQLNLAQLSSLQGQAAGINDSLNRIEQQKVQLDQHQKTLESQMQLFTMLDKDAETAGNPSSPIARQNERLVFLSRQITDTESRLAQMRQVYKPNYPDLRTAQAELQALREERDKLQADQEKELAADQEKELAAKAAPVAPSAKKTNFLAAQNMSQLQGQIDATKAQLQATEMERSQRVKDQVGINKAIESYQLRLAATSGIEAKYADLVRAEKDATEKYQNFVSKQSLSDQNDQLLQRKAGEQLDVLDPPSLPVKPAKPNRLLIVGGGAAASFLIGLALAGLHEAKDSSLKNLKDVRAYTNVPVLCSIPLLENTMLVRRKRRLAYLAWSAAVIIGILAVSSSLYYHYTYAS